MFAKFPVTLVAARELPWAGVTTARDLGARSFPDIAVAAATASGMAGSAWPNWGRWWPSAPTRQAAPVRAHARPGTAQAVSARADTSEHRSLATPDRTYGPDFDPAVVEETADAGMYMYARP